MCNSLCSSIATGTSKLVKNTVFPALFVTVGHSPKFQKLLPSISLTGLADTELSFKPNAISTYVQSQLNLTWVYITSTDIPGLGSSLWENVSQLDIMEIFGTLSSIYKNHKIAIGVAAGIGASATILDAVLKRMPVTRYTNPFLRFGLSVGLASGITLYIAKNELKLPVDPQILMDIAIKIGVVGSMLKVATTSTRLVLKTIRGSSDWLSWTVSGICTGFIGVTNAFDWGSLPTRLESGDKKTKEPEHVSTRKARIFRNQADLQKSNADLEESETPTPSKVRSSKKKERPAPPPEKEESPPATPKAKENSGSGKQSTQTPKKESTADLAETVEEKS